ncbi:hypothetical protein Tco_0624607 [Tanacetum coccineum]|uniref:Uncharacterized protein n=1 Tax=Tanacetum coccineum TaxID=301880 RepID=A0ABQ4WEF4_9ASTR
MGIPIIGQTGELLLLPPVASICKDLRLLVWHSQSDREAKAKKKLVKKRLLKSLNGRLNVIMKSSEEEALEEFNSTLDNVLEKLSQEKDSPDDFYGFMYDTDDYASIIGNSCEHFGWDWPENDSTCTEVDWKDDPLHETKESFVGLDQSIQVVFVQNNVHEDVAEEVIEMANDQAETLSDQEVTDECLDDEQLEERSKRIRVTQEEMVKDEKPKKG